MTQPVPQTLALCRDLLFGSKITATAKAVGVAVRIVRDPQKLADLDGSRLLVDLNMPGHLEAAAAWKARTCGEVIGFIAHVAGDGIVEAKRAGLDRILSNGGFSANLETLLAAGGT
jgi:hypothetical protein